MQCLAVSWSRLLQNDLNIVQERGDTAGGDAVAEEVEFGVGEHALLQVQSQASGGEEGEKCPQCIQCCSLVLL